MEIQALQVLSQWLPLKTHDTTQRGVMKKTTFLIALILFSVLIAGCSRSGKTTCGLGTFLTSSTTVKCDRIMIRFAGDHSADQVEFMSVSYFQVSKEASQGKGAHLDALSALLDCSDPAGFSQVLHQNYEQIFGPRVHPALSLERIHSVVDHAPELQNTCAGVSASG